jgi:hypothetical protein
MVLEEGFKGEFRRKLEDERVGNWVGEGMERRILFEKMKLAWFEILRVDFKFMWDLLFSKEPLL